MQNYLELRQISKYFGDFVANDAIDLTVAKGSIHAIIGENGAGKSTLLNILHGVFPATTGEIKINGKTVKFSNVADAIENGIAKVHQEIVSIPDMTVAENMFMGKEPGKYGIIDKKKMRLKDAGLPPAVLEQTPKYLRRSKTPIVKVKVGPTITTLLCAPEIFDDVPVRKEVKAVVSGLYLTAIKGQHGKKVAAPAKKPSFMDKMRKKAGM